MSTLDIASFLSSCPPFGVLTPKELDDVARNVDIVYVKKDADVVAFNEEMTGYYLIAKGIICEYKESEENYLGAKEGFDFKSLVHGFSEARFYAYEESILYFIPKQVFNASLAKNTRFADFFLQSAAKKLESLSNAQASSMALRISALNGKPPLSIDADAPLYDAVAIMEKYRSNYILVNFSDKTGIVTDSNIRRAILAKSDFNTSCSEFASVGLVTIDHEDFLLNAILLMTKHGVKRLVVTKDGKVHTMLNEMDIVAAFSNQTQFLAFKLEKASTLDEVTTLAQEIFSVVKALYKDGIKSRYITKLVTELNVKVFEKIFSLLASPELLANTALVVMGSEGRGEQILKTDQDNGLIIRDGFNSVEIDYVASRFNVLLQEAGYPLCEGNIMLSNPLWRRTLHDFATWAFDAVNSPNLEGYMNFAILFDARFVFGDETLVKELKSTLFRYTRDQPRFLAGFARPIRDFETPLSFFKTFVLGRGEHKGEFDIKKGAIFALIHGIRVLALEYGIEVTNTYERIKELNNKGIIDREFSQELIESIEFLFRLRLGAKLKKIELGQIPDNYINPKELTSFERDLLKEAFKVVDRFKTFISVHYKLDYLG